MSQNAGGGGGVVGSQPMSTSCTKNFGDLTPYLTYVYDIRFFRDCADQNIQRTPWVCLIMSSLGDQYSVALFSQHKNAFMDFFLSFPVLYPKQCWPRDVTPFFKKLKGSVLSEKRGFETGINRIVLILHTIDIDFQVRLTLNITPNKPLIWSGSWLTRHNCEIYYLSEFYYDSITTDLIFNRVSILCKFVYRMVSSSCLKNLRHKKFILIPKLASKLQCTNSSRERFRRVIVIFASEQAPLLDRLFTCSTNEQQIYNFLKNGNVTHRTLSKTMKQTLYSVKLQWDRMLAPHAGLCRWWLVMWLNHELIMILQRDTL